MPSHHTSCSFARYTSPPSQSSSTDSALNMKATPQQNNNGEGHTVNSSTAEEGDKDPTTLIKQVKTATNNEKDVSASANGEEKKEIMKSEEREKSDEPKHEELFAEEVFEDDVPEENS